MTAQIPPAGRDADPTDPTSEESSTGVDRERLGARLRELRERSGKSLRALSRELGISPSAVSQIERGAMQPSVGRLIAMVDAIGVPLAEVFDGETLGASVGPVPTGRGDGATTDAGAPAAAPPATLVTRAGAVPPVTLGGGVIFRRLSPRPTDDVEFFESTYPAGATSTVHGEFLRHDGYEVGTVTAGTLTIAFDDDGEEITVGAGDSITFPCERPHLISNRSTHEIAVATWLIVHR